MTGLQGFLSEIYIGPILGSLGVAFSCGFLISLLYRWSYKGPGYSVTFVHALVALSMITAVVIMVIGNSLARAFGLVGAMSIIRFRTAIKDTQDIVFIFFALAVGMAAGVGMAVMALVSTLLIGAAILLLARTNYASPHRREYVLQLALSENTSSPETEPPYLPVFERYCKQCRLINVRSLGNGDALELSFYVHLKDRESGGAFIRELGRIPSVRQVNLFYDEEPF